MSKRSSLVPARPAVMDELQWEGNTSFKLAISTIYREDRKKKEGGQLNSCCNRRETEEGSVLAELNWGRW